MNTAESTFFDEVVAASGLTPVIAPFTISRLLLRAGVRGELTQSGLRSALDELDRGLRVYLGDEEAEAAMTRLRALAGAA